MSEGGRLGPGPLGLKEENWGLEPWVWGQGWCGSEEGELCEGEGVEERATVCPENWIERATKVEFTGPGYTLGCHPGRGVTRCPQKQAC